MCLNSLIIPAQPCFSCFHLEPHRRKSSNPLQHQPTTTPTDFTNQLLHQQNTTATNYYSNKLLHHQTTTPTDYYTNRPIHQPTTTQTGHHINRLLYQPTTPDFSAEPHGNATWRRLVATVLAPTRSSATTTVKSSARNDATQLPSPVLLVSYPSKRANSPHLLSPSILHLRPLRITTNCQMHSLLKEAKTTPGFLPRSLVRHLH